MTRIFKGWVVLLGATLVQAASPVVAEPKVTETVEYYDVSGHTQQDVRSSLNELGYMDTREGRRYDGYTRWSIKWRYTYKNTGQECAIATVAVETALNITMPRLKEDANTTPELREAFDGFAAKLMMHEKGHVQIAVDTAKRIEQEMAKLRAEANCTRMGQVANEFGQSLLAESKKQQVDYDARTDHGRSQGVRFPTTLVPSKVTENVDYYDVSGGTAQALRASLDQNRPAQESGGRRFDGVTKWWVNWRYFYKRSEQECGIERVTTDVKVDITLPRLKADEAIPSELRQTFNTYTANLLTHQKGHGQIAIDIAKQIEDGIAKLPAERDCNNMGKVANELGHALLDKARKQQVEYSASTRYGETQGALFP